MKYKNPYYNPMIEKERIWQGKAYRAETGFKHGKEVRAIDVINFEEKELGNKYNISPKIRAELKNYPATDLIWVGKKKADVQRYGIPEEYKLPLGSKIIATDGEGGYLVLKSNYISN